AIEIPGGLSYLAAHDPDALVPGLDRISRADWPNVELTHLSFQVMVGIGMALLGLSAWYWAAEGRRRGGWPPGRALLWAMALAGPLGFIALEAGWVVTEVGRQPWIIHGVMRTRDAVTPARGVPAMFFGFAGLYLLLGVTVVSLLWRLRGLAGRPETEPTPEH
ncbi:MAG: cytochrome ubiquinol oxidase subunit I, partial [Thermoleophilia bacterium]|nr:cytochrome ubiquinol oxidase subunit I [Thermoleophilia bacterium]